jgi:LDH2 family malate/lactate/ureidoglycolate dehydrogenase
MPSDPSAPGLTLHPDRLRALYTAVLRALGGSQEEAAIFAEHFLLADLRGMEWQGLKSLDRHIVSPVRDGVVKLGQPVDVLREGPSSAVLHAHGGLGHVVGRRAVDLAIEMAREQGTGAVAIHECGDTGLLAGFTLRAAEAGCIGIMFNNTNPYVAPWGGEDRLLGIDPFSAAIPAGSAYPVVLDMSIARPRPAFDEDAVWEQPFAQPPVLFFETVREYALTVMIELICGGLAGMPIGLDKGRRGECGAFVLALHVPHFADPAEFRARVDRYVAQVKAAPRAEGTEEILLPGERGFREHERRSREGVPVRESVWSNVARVCAGIGVDAPALAGVSG